MHHHVEVHPLVSDFRLQVLNVLFLLVLKLSLVAGQDLVDLRSQIDTLLLKRSFSAHRFALIYYITKKLVICLLINNVVLDDPLRRYLLDDIRQLDHTLAEHESIHPVSKEIECIAAGSSLDEVDHGDAFLLFGDWVF